MPSISRRIRPASIDDWAARYASTLSAELEKER
jgi:hypothetical protein